MVEARREGQENVPAFFVRLWKLHGSKVAGVKRTYRAPWSTGQHSLPQPSTLRAKYDRSTGEFVCRVTGPLSESIQEPETLVIILFMHSARTIQ